MKKTTKRALSLMLSLILALAMLPSMVFAADYESHWAKSQIEQLIEKGIVTPDPGTGNTNPNRNLTRAEMSRLINQAFGLTETADISAFSDVPAGSWFAQDVAKAVAAGYMVGNAGKFRPNDAITRQEVAQVATSFLSVSGNAASADKMSDAAAISGWAKGAVGAAISSGLMNGYPDGSFKPLNNMTRAEAFVVLLNMMNADEGGTDKVDEDAVTVSQGETFGESGSVTTVKSLVVDGRDATVKNTVVTGDLTITEKVGDGDVFLEGVEVRGNTYVRGGGANSVRVKDGDKVKSNHKNMVVTKLNVTIRLESGEIVKITFEAGGKAVNGGGTIGLAVIDTSGNVTLSGNFTQVDVASQANLQLSDAAVEVLKVMQDAVNSRITNNSGSKIDQVIVDAAASFLGNGTISNMEVNAAGVTSERLPSSTSGSENVTVGSGGGGGGGGGGSSSDDSTSTVFSVKSVAPTASAYVMKVTLSKGISNDDKNAYGKFTISTTDSVASAWTSVTGTAMGTTTSVSGDVPVGAKEFYVQFNTNSITANGANIKDGGVVTLTVNEGLKANDNTTLKTKNTTTWTKAKSADVDLSGLEFGRGAGATSSVSAFNASNHSYSITGVTETYGRIKATAKNLTATSAIEQKLEYKVNDGAWQSLNSGVESGAINFSTRGELTLITVRVTAPAGNTSLYTITVVPDGYANVVLVPMNGVASLGTGDDEGNINLPTAGAGKRYVLYVNGTAKYVTEDGSVSNNWYDIEPLEGTVIGDDGLTTGGTVLYFLREATDNAQITIASGNSEIYKLSSTALNVDTKASEAQRQADAIITGGVAPIKGVLQIPDAATFANTGIYSKADYNAIIAGDTRNAVASLFNGKSAVESATVVTAPNAEAATHKLLVMTESLRLVAYDILREASTDNTLDVDGTNTINGFAVSATALSGGTVISNPAADLQNTVKGTTIPTVEIKLPSTVGASNAAAVFTQKDIVNAEIGWYYAADIASIPSIEVANLQEDAQDAFADGSYVIVVVKAESGSVRVFKFQIKHVTAPGNTVGQSGPTPSRPTITNTLPTPTTETQARALAGTTDFTWTATAGGVTNQLWVSNFKVDAADGTVVPIDWNKNVTVINTDTDGTFTKIGENTEGTVQPISGNFRPANFSKSADTNYYLFVETDKDGKIQNAYGVKVALTDVAQVIVMDNTDRSAGTKDVGSYAVWKDATEATGSIASGLTIALGSKKFAIADCQGTAPNRIEFYTTDVVGDGQALPTTGSRTGTKSFTFSNFIVDVQVGNTWNVAAKLTDRQYTIGDGGTGTIALAADEKSVYYNGAEYALPSSSVVNALKKLKATDKFTLANSGLISAIEKNSIDAMDALELADADCDTTVTLTNKATNTQPIKVTLASGFTKNITLAGTQDTNKPIFTITGKTSGTVSSTAADVASVTAATTGFKMDTGSTAVKLNGISFAGSGGNVSIIGTDSYGLGGAVVTVTETAAIGKTFTLLKDSAAHIIGGTTFNSNNDGANAENPQNTVKYAAAAGAENAVFEIGGKGTVTLATTADIDYKIVDADTIIAFGASTNTFSGADVIVTCTTASSAYTAKAGDGTALTVETADTYTLTLDEVTDLTVKAGTAVTLAAASNLTSLTVKAGAVTTANATIGTLTVDGGTVTAGGATITTLNVSACTEVTAVAATIADVNVSGGTDVDLSGATEITGTITLTPQEDDETSVVKLPIANLEFTVEGAAYVVQGASAAASGVQDTALSGDGATGEAGKLSITSLGVVTLEQPGSANSGAGSWVLQAEEDGSGAGSAHARAKVTTTAASGAFTAITITFAYPDQS